MKSPIGQRTLLSIAVAASLACVSGGNALADGSISYSGGDESGVIEITGTYGDNLVLYDPDQESSLEEGETISSLLSKLPDSGDIVLSLEGNSDADTLHILGTVYGIATAYDDVIETDANLTIYVNNAQIDGNGELSYIAGKPDSVLYGVYAAGSSEVTFGDVTINIKNSILGSSEDGYNDVVIGARSSDSASLTVGNVTIIVDDEADGEEYSRIFGVRHNSSETITIGNIYVEVTGYAVGGRVEGYTQENFEETHHPTGDANIGNVTVKIEGVDTTDPSTGETTYSTFAGYAHGCNLTWMVPEVTIGNIVLELSKLTMVQETEYEFVGLNTRDAASQMSDTTVDVYSTVVTAESVSVKAKNIDNPDTGSFRAIEKFDAGTVTVKGNVSLAADTMTTASHSIDAISLGAGTLVVGGNTSMYVKDVNSLNIYAFRAEFYSDTSPSETKINATMNGIDLVYVSTTSDYQVTNNIYGAATETNGNGYIGTIKTGDISVTIAGSAKAMGFKAGGGDDDGFKSIYGTVAGSGTIESRTRTLVFGYDGTDIDGIKSTVTFDSTADNPFNATFSNFDEVVVKSGSSLYLTSSQKGFNFTDDCGSFFDTGDEADDGHSLWSEDGVLYLVETSGLTIEEGGLADIMIVVNNGAIEVNGALTTYISSKEFLIIEGDKQTDITCTSSNSETGTISGEGTLTILAGDLTDEKGFVNSGSINIYGISVGEDAILSGSGALTVTGSVSNSGTISVDGTTTFSGAAVENSSQITIGTDGTLTADGVTYKQTDGSFTVTGNTSESTSSESASKWFTNSDITISGGTLDSYNLGSGNAYTIDGGTYTIYELTDSGSSTVTIKSGSLTVTEIASDISSTVVTLSGGSLRTTPDQVFSDTITAILMDESGTAAIPVEEYIFVGDVLDSVINGLKVDGSGEICLIVDTYSESMAQSAVANFQAAGFDSSLTITFEGELITTGVFDVAAANELIGEGGQASSPGIILNTVTLVGSSTLYVGGDTASSNTILSPGMGFMNVSGTDKVFVTEGTFVLVGKVGGSYDDDQLLLDASIGGDVQVLSGATFSLGTQGATSSSGGFIGTTSIEGGGAFNVKNGEFAVWSIENDGTITIDSNGILHTASLTPSGTASTGSTSTVVNNGTLIFETFGDIDKPALTVDGTFENNGTLTADDVDTVTVSEGGTLKNAGTLTSNNISVSGEAENTGTWTSSGTITVSGENSNIANSGTITAGALTVDEYGSIGNNADSTFTVTGSTTISSGALLNEGTFEAQGGLAVTVTEGVINDTNGTLTITGGATISDDGTFANAGTVTADNITVSDTGSLSNTDGGTLEVTDTLAVQGEGVVHNESILKTSSLTIADSGSVTSSGSSASISVDSFSISSGSLDIADGTFTASSTTLDGGTVALGSSSAVSVELSEPTGDIGTQISVLNGSRLSIGSSDYGLDWADSETGSSVGNLLVVSAPITTTDTGGISVGAESTGAGLYFSADSTLVVSVDSLNGSAAFITTAGTTATIESGATLVLGGSITKGDSYTILQGYTADIADDAWGYTTNNEDYLYGEDNNGLKWTFNLVSEDGKVYVQAVAHEDVAESLGEDLADPNIVNDAFDHCSSDPGSSLICGILTDSDMSKEDQQKTLNSITEIAFAGGVMATTMTDVTAAVDSVHNHLTMDGDTFGKDGNLWPWDKSSNLWIDVLGSWQHGKHLNATSISNYKYRTNSYGFILGYDYKLPDRPVVIGGAFSFSDGDLKSKGGVSKTKNDYQTYGVSLYGNYSPSSYYNIIGSVHWFHNSADIKQYTSSGKATAKVQTNLIAVGLRGETTIKAGQVNVIPHAEARYIYGKSGKYTTKLDGAGLWSTKADGTHTVQFPVGVAARTDIKTNSGWNIRPKADVSVIPQVGSSKQKSIVRANDGVTDPIEGQFMGKFGASIKLGVQADKSNATVGLRYGFLGGTKGRADHSVMLQGRLRF